MYPITFFSLQPLPPHFSPQVPPDNPPQDNPPQVILQDMDDDESHDESSHKSNNERSTAILEQFSMISSSFLNTVIMDINSNDDDDGNYGIPDTRGAHTKFDHIHALKCILDDHLGSPLP